jgi:hypothetical protein
VRDNSLALPMCALRLLRFVFVRSRKKDASVPHFLRYLLKAAQLAGILMHTLRDSRSIQLSRKRTIICVPYLIAVSPSWVTLDCAILDYSNAKKEKTANARAYQFRYSNNVHEPFQPITAPFEPPCACRIPSRAQQEETHLAGNGN